MGLAELKYACTTVYLVVNFKLELIYNITITLGDDIETLDTTEPAALEKHDDLYEVFPDEDYDMDTNLLSPNGGLDRQGDDVDIMGDIEELDGQHFEVLDTVDSAGEGATGDSSQYEGNL